MWTKYKLVFWKNDSKAGLAAVSATSSVATSDESTRYLNFVLPRKLKFAQFSPVIWQLTVTHEIEHSLRCFFPKPTKTTQNKRMPQFSLGFAISVLLSSQPSSSRERSNFFGIVTNDGEVIRNRFSAIFPSRDSHLDLRTQKPRADFLQNDWLFQNPLHSQKLVRIFKICAGFVNCMATLRER